MKSTIINGYELVTPFTTTGGGHCQWAFARRGGQEYFIKRFLKPTYPLPDGPGSAKTKAEKLAQCERFARHHNDVNDRLAALSGRGGNLIVALDFFRHGTRYYKVTAKVAAGADWMSGIARLSDQDKVTLMMKVVNSLEILHKQRLVHGDIKPPNLLVERIDSGLATKLIDFDNCFVPGSPPAPDELVGDLVYYSPEMIDYLVRVGPASALTEKADIFALGLTFTEYVNGALPAFPAECKYPGEAARRGLPLVVGGGPFGGLLAAMLDPDPARRPGCREIRDALQQLRRALSGRPVTHPVATDPPARGLRGTLVGRAGKETGEPATGRSGLRGRLAPSRVDGTAPIPTALRGKLTPRGRGAGGEEVDGGTSEPSA